MVNPHEASFDNGRLSGIKSRWWENGLIREEEYWVRKVSGQRLWDESGRLAKNATLEVIPQSLHW